MKSANMTVRPHKRALLSAAVLAVGLFSSTSHAALSFQYDFQGEFLTNNVARQAVIDAGNLYSQMFATHFNNTASVQFNVVSTPDGLASAGSFQTNVPGFGGGEYVRNKIVNGIDLNPGGSLGVINVNLAINFQLDPNAPVDFAGGQIDFFSVFDHEVTHALGLTTRVDGTDKTDFNKYDQFLTTLLGVPLVDPITGMVNQTARTDALNNGALFAGPRAIAAYGAPVPIEGVAGELSHLGTVAFSFPTSSQNALMLCCGGLVNSFEPRDYNAAEIGILADLGYTTVNAVPLPPSYSLALAALGVVGFMRKRRVS